MVYFYMEATNLYEDGNSVGNRTELVVSGSDYAEVKAKIVSAIGAVFPAGAPYRIHLFYMVGGLTGEMWRFNSVAELP